MDHEIEFRAVGDSSKAGDAIVIRYVLENTYHVIVVDGGTDESGKAMAEHIKAEYGPDTVIDHVVSSHPDTDHACGLRTILAEFRVKNLWLHGVWHHAADMLHLFDDKRWTAEGLAREIRSRYSVVEELIDLANDQGTNIYQPFAGDRIGPFTVLSPTKYAYVHLVPQFRKTPACDNDALEAANMYLGTKYYGEDAHGSLAAMLKGLLANVAEYWNVETLKEGPLTAAENESSTILFGDFGERKVLLTSDGGINALTWACDFADNNGLPISELAVVQVPHHGSRSNVAPSILNRVLGPIVPQGTVSGKYAVVSAPKDDSKHPRKIVMNAFRRRGFPVYKTQGTSLRSHFGNMPARPNETSAEPFEFFSEVESYD